MGSITKHYSKLELLTTWCISLLWSYYYLRTFFEIFRITFTANGNLYKWPNKYTFIPSFFHKKYFAQFLICLSPGFEKLPNWSWRSPFARNSDSESLYYRVVTSYRQSSDQSQTALLLSLTSLGLLGHHRQPQQVLNYFPCSLFLY